MRYRWSSVQGADNVHTICIVDSRLAILMRNNPLPELMDVQIDELRQAKARIFAAQVGGHRRPELAPLIIRDMSVVKPQSTYTQDEYGQNVYSWSHPASLRYTSCASPFSRLQSSMCITSMRSS